jgi:hypothetical protein
MNKRPAFNPSARRAYDSPKKAIGELVAQRGGIKNVQVLLGYKADTQVYGFTSDTSDAEISFAQVAALTEPGATAAAEYLSLRAGGVFLPVAPEAADCPTLCADDARLHGEETASVVEALARGFEGTAGAAALAKIDASLRALTGLRAAVVATLSTNRPQ